MDKLRDEAEKERLYKKREGQLLKKFKHEVRPFLYDLFGTRVFSTRGRGRTTRFIVGSPFFA